MKRIITFLFAIMFLLTTGFGCKGLSSQQQQAVRPVALEYWTVYNDVDMLKKFAAEYKIYNADEKWIRGRMRIFFSNREFMLFHKLQRQIVIGDLVASQRRAVAICDCQPDK